MKNANRANAHALINFSAQMNYTANCASTYALIRSDLMN